MSDFDLLQTFVGVPVDDTDPCIGGGDEFETTELASPEERLIQMVENCPLIEKPEDTSKAKNPNLRHDLTDCKGWLEEIPFREPNADANIPSTVIDQVMLTAGKQFCISSPFLGHLVSSGCLGLYSDNGVIKAVGKLVPIFEMLM